MKDKQARTYEDLQKQLDEQVRFLKTSADLYDSGSEIEAKRMAVALRILLHDTPRSISLLTSLNRKDTQFLDTSDEDISNVITSHCGLAYRALGTGRPQYIALLDDAQGRMRDFADWWNESVLKDMEGHSLSRRDVVLTMADQDGGAHVDPAVDRPYQRIKTGQSTGHMWSDGTGWKKMEGAEIATVRQITHEVLKTIDPTYSKRPVLPQGAVTFGGFRLEYAEGDPQETKQAPAKKIGSNEECHCGSGKKFKKCHGA